jgi:hypothetical protein
MLVKALTSFAGAISMSEGETQEVNDNAIVQDLLRAGYIEIAVPEAEIVEKPVENSANTTKKKSKR